MSFGSLINVMQQVEQNKRERESRARDEIKQQLLPAGNFPLLFSVHGFERMKVRACV